MEPHNREEHTMISVKKQAQDYAAWALEHGYKRIALFPMKRSGHTVEARGELLAALNVQRWRGTRNSIDGAQWLAESAGFSFPEVDSSEYAKEVRK